MTAALDHLLSDESRRRTIGAAARERSEEFSIEHIASRFERLYASLLEQGRR
jgi:glycosyltransferase involved in cell wall biosynthesis